MKMKRKMIFVLTVLLVFMAAFPVYAAKGDIGYINRQKILANYPAMPEIVKDIEARRAEAQKEYDTRAKNLPEKERAAINNEIALRVAKEEAEIMAPVGEKINAAVARAAQKNGCEYVLDAAMMHYGGKDLTDLVIKELGQ